MTREEFLKVIPDLVKDYMRPAAVLARISGIELLIIVGATGVGKTTVIKRLGIPYVVADTTRPIRPDEINGTDYFFRTDYDQLINEIKRREYVQIAIGPAGDFYGTRASSYPEVGLAVCAVVADVVPQFRELGFSETTTAFITPPEFLEWMDRMDRHNIETDQLSKRLKEAKRSFNFALNDPKTHFILNDDVDKAVHQTTMLLNGDIDSEREDKAREAARQIYWELTFA
jgi:guanylate kinase